LVALLELRDRAEKLNCGAADHYVSPACENGRIDATRPMKNWRTAWRSVTRAVSCPSCGTEHGLGDQTIMAIAGHVNRAMLEHYSHVRLQAKRQALAALETARAERV